MSNDTGAIAAGVVVGVVVGVYSGNPYAGVQAGLVTYGLVSGYNAYREAQRGRGEPGLQDKRVTAAEYGAPIPICYGTSKVNGILVWGRDLFQQAVPGTEGGGGKGGGGGGSGSSANYITYARFAVKLCKGPIVGVSRLWLDDKLYFDGRASSTGALTNIELGDISVDYQDGKEQAGYITSRGSVTIYTGTETQVPDPYISSFVGDGYTNAFRGDAYLVFRDLIVDSFGKRIPNVTAEVVLSGATEDVKAGPVVLDGYSILPAANSSMTAEKLAFIYDPYSDAFISKIYVASGSFVSRGWNLQSIKVGAHTSNWSYSAEEGLNQYTGGFQMRRDSAGPYIIFADSAYLYFYSSITGAQVVKKNLSVLSGYSAGNNRCVESNSASGEIWLNAVNTIYVFNKEEILRGSALNVAQIKTIPHGNTGQTVSLYEVPHKSWMIAQGGLQGGTAQIYDTAGNTIRAYGDLFSGATSGGWLCNNFVVDKINDGFWFVAEQGLSRRLYFFSFATFASSQLVDDAGLSNNAITLDDLSGHAIIYHSTAKQLRWYATDGGVFKSIDITTEVNAYGYPIWLGYAPSQQEVVAHMWPNTGYLTRNVFFFKQGMIAGAPETISEIVDSVANEVGLSHSDLDVTALASDTINGYSVDSRMQGRSAVDPLKRIAFFDLIHEDGKVKARKFGGASVMTINYQDLIIPDESDAKRPYTVKRADELDLPQVIDVAYSDTAFDYETQIQTASRITRRSTNKAIVTIPAAITADAARKTAEVALYQAWAARTQWTLNGSRKHWALNIGDAFTFVDEVGASRRLLCIGREMLGMTRLTITAIADDSAVYTSAAVGGSAGWTPPVIAAPTLKRLDLLDIPILRDEDNYAGFYAVADSSSPGAVLYESVDGGITYNSLGSLQESSTGYATTTLANFIGGNVWDTVSTVTVTVYSGTLESVTDLQVLAGLNTALLGNEIIQYATATLSGTNTYTLSRLLRGRKGTEWAIGSHGSSERFVPLPVNMARISSAARGAMRYYKAVRNGASITDAPAQAFTNTQAGMKPYSVVNIAGTRDGSNNLTITWARRSRIGTAWGVTDALPLDDTVESYQVDIMQGSVVKRTISSTSPTCSYSAADQTTDFGSVQLSLLVNVYQMSTIVGRGTVSAKTI